MYRPASGPCRQRIIPQVTPESEAGDGHLPARIDVTTRLTSAWITNIEIQSLSGLDFRDAMH